MAYVRVPDPNLNNDKATRSIDIIQMRDNQDEFDTRITDVDPDIRHFDHFNSNFQSLGGTRNWDLGVWQETGHTTRDGEGSQYVLFDANNNSEGAHNPVKPAYSVNRLARSTSPTWAAAFDRFQLQFDQVTKPMTLTARIKVSADGNLVVGIREMRDEDPATDRAGIWLEKVDGTDYRFVTFDTSRNNGVSFTKPTIGNWFEMKIEFTNTPSNRAICSIDGDIKDTITTQLPIARILHFLLGVAPATNFNFDIDRLSFKCAALLDAS